MDLRRQYETEVGDLQVTIKRLKKVCMWHLDILERASVSHCI